MYKNIILILVSTLLVDTASGTSIINTQEMYQTLRRSPFQRLLEGQIKRTRAIHINHPRYASRLYSEDIKTGHPIGSPQTKHAFPPTKWRTEEIYSPTFWVRSLGVSAGVAVTTGIAWWTYNFEKRQNEKIERMGFLTKTRDYLNDQLKENSLLFSELFADATYEQSMIQYFRSAEEREVKIKKYLLFDRKIEMSLEYYNNLSARLNLIYDSSNSTLSIKNSGKHELLSAVQHDLETQRINLSIAKYLNKALLYFELETYGLAEQNLNILINSYIEAREIDVHEALSYKDSGPILSIFHNLRVLTKFKQADLNIADHKEFLNVIEQILHQDLNIAEHLDPQNPYIYEHKFFIYQTLKKHGNSINPSDYEEKSKKNALKAYHLAPKNPASLNVMGLYKYTSCQYYAALHYFKQALILLPNCPLIINNLALTHLALGRHTHLSHHYEKALKYAHQCNKLYPNYKTTRVYLEALSECGKCLKAYNKLEILKELCEDHASCKRTLKLKRAEEILKVKCSAKPILS